MENEDNIAKQGSDAQCRQAALDFIVKTAKYRYSYNFKWMGRPVIQYPQDIVAMQEIIWAVKPDLIVETGIAHGGSLIFYASMLELIELCEGAPAGKGKRMVLGIDIDIREHNRREIERHPMYHRIKMIEGSSIDRPVIDEVCRIAGEYERVMLCLDSNHTHDHVRQELDAYSGIVSVGSYCIVFDTIIEDMPDGSFPDRPWGKGDNPKTAVQEFLRGNERFVIDDGVESRILITVAPGGYLKRIR